MRKFRIVHSFWILVFCLGCETSVSIEADHEPVLQVESVFYAGEPLSDILFLKSFNVTGSGPRTIPFSELEVRDIEIELFKNDTLVSVRYVGGGYFRPDSSFTVYQGDAISIHAKNSAFDVRATAKVPIVPTDSVRFEITSVGRELKIGARRRSDRQIIDSMWVYLLQGSFEQSFVPPFTAMQWFSASEEWFSETYRTPFTPEFNAFSEAFDFTRFYGDEFQGIPRIVWRQEIRAIFPIDEKPSGPTPITFYATLIYPEEIYVTANRLSSDAFVPVTITNVEGGVGLFIGAVREEKEFELTVDFAE